jgi:arylsulfatase A-like enzyme
LFLQFYNCHRPYHPPAPFDRLFLREGTPSPPEVTGFCRRAEESGQLPSSSELDTITAQYDGEIAFADQLLGRLFRQIETLGLGSSTLVVFLSDHGDELFEHGNCDHIKSLYDPLVRVPLVIRGPGIPRGVRVVEPFELLDVGQLILDFLEVPQRLGEGRSILERLRRGEALGGLAAYSETSHKGYVIRDGRWHYAPSNVTIRALRSASAKLVTNATGEPLELYDLARDPGEQHNLLGDAASPHHPSAGEHLAALTRAIQERLARAQVKPTREAEVEAPTLEELRALGYIE